jgi:hypothetical protein
LTVSLCLIVIREGFLSCLQGWGSLNLNFSTVNDGHQIRVTQAILLSGMLQKVKWELDT